LASAEVERARAETTRAAAEAERTRLLAAVEVEGMREVRRRLAREDRARRREAAVEARRARVRAVASGVLAHAGLGPALAVIVASAGIACWGQYVYARDVMALSPAAAVLVPVMIEGATWSVAWLTIRATATGRPAGVLHAATWVLALLAAAANGWHGATAGGVAVGVSYALASLMGPVMWELLLSTARARAHGQTAAQTRAALLRWVRWPVTAWTAATLAAARNCPAEEAWRAAWRDRRGVDVDADARTRWLAGRVRRRQRRADLAGVAEDRWSLVDGRLVPTAPAAPSRRPDTSARRTGTSPGTASSAAARRVEAPGRARYGDVSALLPLAREVAGELAGEGRPLTRRALTQRLRARGASCSTARAGELLHLLRTPGPPPPVEHVPVEHVLGEPVAVERVVVEHVQS
jgi:hypothetical protein